jgi:23S rRNA (cytosine1962-C5)-methyltransferase
MRDSALRGPFSIIVADPPKVVARRRDLDAARTGMRRLVDNLVGRLHPDGMLLLCSCSHHFGRRELDATVALAAPGRLVRVSWRGADMDHPVLPGHTEGEYLRVGVYRRR